MNITELRAAALRIAYQARDLIAANTTIDAEKNAEIDRMLADSDAYEARAVQLEAIENREKAYNASASRAPVETIEARTAGASDEEQRAMAFADYCRGDIDERELRAQGVAPTSAGGYLVPQGYWNKLVTVAKQYGPLNEGGPVTYIVTESGNDMPMPKMDDTANMGSQLAEGAEAGESNVAFSNLIFKAWKYSTGTTRISNELLQDSAQPITEVVGRAHGIRLGRILNKDFTTGDGTTQPQGIVTGAGAGITAASATALTYDDMVAFYHSVDPAYRDNFTFMFNDAILAKLRKIKDANGVPLWNLGVAGGAPATILDKPYVINNAMNDTLASTNVSVIGGDLSQFVVRRVREFGLKRLDERFATFDQVGFVGFGRYDSKVVDSTAIKKLTH